MGKGGGGGTQKVVQSNIPEYAEPYVRDILDRGAAESLREYEPYGGQRIAGTNADIEAARSGIRSLGPMGFGGARDMLSQAGQAAGNVGGGFSQFGFSPAGTYTAQNVQQYMDPYMQNVVNRQKAQAQLDFDRMQSSRDAAAVQAGAFGGSRGAVVDALAQEDLARRMGDIQAQGLSQAYGQGAQLFEQDRAARMATEGAQAGELGRVQDAMARYGLGGAELQAGLAGQLAGLDEAERAAELQRLGALGDVGGAIRGEEQAGMDLAYEDFLRQQNYPREQLDWYRGLVSGTPMGQTTTSQQITEVNPFQQLMGAGISLAGLQRAGIF